MRRVKEHLPLKPREFLILLALTDEDSHGYAIKKAVEERNAVRLEAGTLYRLLNRLLDSGLIVESRKRPAPDLDDERRRYYRLTPLGRNVVSAEAARLAELVEQARARHLLESKESSR